MHWRNWWRAEFESHPLPHYLPAVEGDHSDVAGAAEQCPGTEGPVADRRTGDTVLGEGGDVCLLSAPALPRRSGGLFRGFFPGCKNFPGKGRFQPGLAECDDGELLPGTGHPHIEEPPLLLIGVPLRRGGGLVPQHLGQQPVGHIHQNHAVIFQPLAGVDGGEDERAAGLGSWAPSASRMSALPRSPPRSSR